MSDLPEPIDLAWLQACFEAAGIAAGASLRGATFAEWIGTGQVGRNARLRLEWAAPDRPATVVVKLPSADPETAALAFAQGTYKTELDFYENVAPTVGCRTPACHGTLYRPDDGHFVLLMEDVVGAVQGDQFAGLSDDHLDLALGQAVALHAPRAGDPTLPAAFGVRGDPIATRDLVAGLVAELYAGSVEGMVERLGADLDDEVVRMFRDAVAPMAAVVAAADEPVTVSHGDLRADNLLFGVETGAPPVVVVDWQTVRAGSGAADVAYLVSGSIPDPEDRLARERGLVAGYLDRMAAADVQVDPDDFWRHYRRGALWGLMITAVATMTAARTERGDALFTVMAQRHGWQAVHLDAIAACS